MSTRQAKPFTVLPGAVERPDTYEDFVRLPPFTVVRGRGETHVLDDVRIKKVEPHYFPLRCISQIRRLGYEFQDAGTEGNELSFHAKIVEHVHPENHPDHQADELAAWLITTTAAHVAKVPVDFTSGAYHWVVVDEKRNRHS